MTDSKGDEKKTRDRVRKPLPKIKKLNNTQEMLDQAGGLGGNPGSIMCPTPQQPGYTMKTHLPFC